MKWSIALLAVALVGILPSTSVQAAAPKLAADGSLAKQNGRTYLSVNLYSRTRFSYGSEKELQRLAEDYRPKNVVVTVGGKRFKLKALGTALPEFVFGFGNYATGLKATKTYAGRVSFTNKAKGAQTLKLRIKP